MKQRRRLIESKTENDGEKETDREKGLIGEVKDTDRKGETKVRKKKKETLNKRMRTEEREKQIERSRRREKKA